MFESYGMVVAMRDAVSMSCSSYEYDVYPICWILMRRFHFTRFLLHCSLCNRNFRIENKHVIDNCMNYVKRANKLQVTNV